MLEELLRKIKNAQEATREKVSILLDILQQEDLLRFPEPSDDVPLLAGIDGGFEKTNSFINDLVYIRIAAVKESVGKTVSFELMKLPKEIITEASKALEIMPIDLDERLFSGLYYGRETFVDDESLRMLYLEALLALLMLQEVDVLLLDGPVFNPPRREETYGEEIAKENYAYRQALLDSHKVLGIVKRHRRSFLKELLEKHGEHTEASEGFLLVQLLTVLREKRPYEPIVIGPFEYSPFRDRKLYAWYVSRVLYHKPVVVETPTEEFPSRLLNKAVWPPSSRSRSPAVIEAAHGFASVSREEAWRVFSIFYALVRLYGSRRGYWARIEPGKAFGGR